MSLDSQATSAAIYKQLFTDAEWDAISSALNDYQDYGDEEANIADSIQAKIATIYKLTNWLSTEIIMNKMTTKALTFRQALNILEEEFDSIYRGISTVKEMTTDLMSAISFEGENPETIYHRFETKVGPNRIVKDDQIIALALHYVWSILTQWESFLLLSLLSSVQILASIC